MEAMLREAVRFLSSYPRERMGTLAFSNAVAVFGRHCPLLARRVAQICNQGGATHVVISGNVGKDSGQLAKWGVPEAHYILSAAEAQKPYAFSQAEVGIDLTAKNGVENAARMVEMLDGFGCGKSGAQRRVAVVAHYTQMLRLGLTFDRALAQTDMSFGSTLWMPSEYRPSPDRQQDQWEICFELVRLAEMHAAGEIGGPVVPADLLEWASEFMPDVAADLRAQGLPLSTAGLRSF